MPLGGTLLPITNEDYRKLVDGGSVTVLVEKNYAHMDMVGDLVDAVNDEDLDEEVEAEIAEIEKVQDPDIFRYQLVYPPKQT